MAGQPLSDEHQRRDNIDKEPRIPNRLILCFDGTGNSFKGAPGDTNIVKLLNMFDRSAPRQMHYYQPGIGTYTADGAVNLNVFGRIKRSISQAIDSGFATSFDAHVIAGYRFLMRYYGPGDRIYIFGFSRGAFTARFLARMIAHVGLLSMGNEEMVQFAYKVYQDYEMGVKGARAYMETFRSYFCRHEEMSLPDAPKSSNIQVGKYMDEDVEECSDEERCRHNELENENTKPKMVDTGIKVHFLGLFDTVNSVGTFDVPFTKTPKVSDVLGTAEHVRHAVAIDERRVKFKAALLAQDVKIRYENSSAESQPDGKFTTKDHENCLPLKIEEVIKEVWFPGNHGDIGGGWLPEAEPNQPETWWQRIKRALPYPKVKDTSRAHQNVLNDLFQLSDIALKWMVDELDNLDPKIDHVLWNEDKKQSFLKRFARHRPQAIKGFMHDTMIIGRGSSCWKTMMWKLMEYLPLVRRWEYVHNKKTAAWEWQYKTFPLNKGDSRDIPEGALFHHSVVERMQRFHTYRPENQLTVGKEGLNLNKVLLGSANGNTIGNAQREYPVEYNKKGLRDTEKVFRIVK